MKVSQREEPQKIDTVLADFDFPLSATFHPMGLSVNISTNSPAVLDAARDSWGALKPMFAYPPVRVRIGVVPGGSAETLPAPVYRSQQHLMSIIADVENFMVCDMRRGFAYGWVTQSVVENNTYIRGHIIEPSSNLLLVASFLTPVHAACLNRHGRGELLCGDSTAGKSTLAYACARAGWKFLSDDFSCLIRGRNGRVVIGNPARMRFRAPTLDLFPELKMQRLIPRLNGGPAVEVDTVCMPGIETMSHCSIDHIIFLNRSNSHPPTFVPYSKERAKASFENVISYGEDQVRKEQKESLRELFDAEVVEFRYDDLALAVPALDAFVRRAIHPVEEVTHHAECRASD
jgi:hypothetical protein